MTLPILYSFRRCPYAIRARLGLVCAEQNVAIREIVLRSKPQSMLAISAKGTVPVLLLEDGTVIDESRDIVQWALELNDPKQLLVQSESIKATNQLIDENDGDFKNWLDRYKYADRYPEHSAQYYRGRAEVFIDKLDTRLQDKPFLFGSTMSLADMAIVPFIRQFAQVDKQWFFNAGYSNVQRWLEIWLQSPLFLSVMKKYPLWDEMSGANQEVLIEGGDDDETSHSV